MNPAGTSRRIVAFFLVVAWVLASAAVPLLLPSRAAAVDTLLYESTFGADCTFNSGSYTWTSGLWYASQHGGTGVCRTPSSGNASGVNPSTYSLSVTAGEDYLVTARAAGGSADRTVSIRWYSGATALTPDVLVGTATNSAMVTISTTATAPAGADGMRLYRSNTTWYDSFAVYRVDADPTPTPGPTGTPGPTATPTPSPTPSPTPIQPEDCVWDPALGRFVAEDGGSCERAGRRDWWARDPYNNVEDDNGAQGCSTDRANMWIGVIPQIRIASCAHSSSQYRQAVEWTRASSPVPEGSTTYAGEVRGARRVGLWTQSTPFQGGVPGVTGYFGDCTGIFSGSCLKQDLPPNGGIMAFVVDKVTGEIDSYWPSIGGDYFRGDPTGTKSWRVGHSPAHIFDFGRARDGYLFFRAAVGCVPISADWAGGGGDPFKTGCGQPMELRWENAYLLDQGEFVGSVGNSQQWPICADPGCMPEHADIPGGTLLPPTNPADGCPESVCDPVDGGAPGGYGGAPIFGCPISGDPTKGCLQLYCAQPSGWLDVPGILSHIACLVAHIPLAMANVLIDVFVPGLRMEAEWSDFMASTGERVPFVWAGEVVDFLTFTMTSSNLAGGSLVWSFVIMDAPVSFDVTGIAAALDDYRPVLAGLVWLALAWALFRAVGAALGMRPSGSDGAA